MSKTKFSRRTLLRALKAIQRNTTEQVTRDYFRAQFPCDDAWTVYWPSFAAFLKAAGIQPAVAAAAPVEELPLSPEQRFDLDKEKLKAKQDDVYERLKFATEKIIELEREKSELLSIKGRTPQITIISPKVPSGASEAVAVALASDWHAEENIESSAVSGKNEFNLEIADKRITKFWQGSLRLYNIMARESTIKTFIVALLGDFISNTIHEDLQESNNLMPADAIYWVESRIVSGIKFLLDNAPKDVEFLLPCHSGNHARMTKKQRGSTEKGNSLEHFMYFHMRDHFSGEPRIKFQIAEGYHTFTELFDGKYVIRWHHGHAVKFGGGIGGITIPINKSIAQWNKAHKQVDLDCLGHFHDFIDGGNFIVNGSLVGYNDYAVRMKMPFELPQQVFFTVSKKWLSKTMTTPIFLS